VADGVSAVLFACASFERGAVPNFTASADERDVTAEPVPVVGDVGEADGVAPAAAGCNAAVAASAAAFASEARVAALVAHEGRVVEIVEAGWDVMVGAICLARCNVGSTTGT